MQIPSVSHGGGTRGQAAGAMPDVPYGRYGAMFDLPPATPLSDAALTAIAAAMIKQDAGKPITEAETIDENPTIPALYTYFGQFVDHDITFDPTPLAAANNDLSALVDFRSPALDMDNVYGRGPDDQPYMYEGLRLRLGAQIGAPGAVIGNQRDLHRLEDGTAILGDKRNDENKIVSQLQAAMIQLHNKVVDNVPLLTSFLCRPPESDAERFRTAATIVRWHYQWVVMFDYLDRICAQGTVAGIYNNGSPMLGHYLNDKAPYGYMPVEFSVAAFRFGHSMVRPSYALNRDAIASTPPVPNSRIPIFVPEGTTGAKDSLSGVPGKGVGTLPAGWGMDVAFFLDGLPKPAQGVDGFRLPQPSYRIDALLAEPLRALPEFAKDPKPLMANLAYRNLLRGQRLNLPSGEAVSMALGITPLAPEIIWGAGSAKMTKAALAARPDDEQKDFNNVQVARAEVLETFGGAGLAGSTPLWYYILREAEHYGWTNDANEPGVIYGGQHLGPVGSHIVAETLIGMLWVDQGSFLHDRRGFRPMPQITGGKELTLAVLMEYALTTP